MPSYSAKAPSSHSGDWDDLYPFTPPGSDVPIGYSGLDSRFSKNPIQTNAIDALLADLPDHDCEWSQTEIEVPVRSSNLRRSRHAPGRGRGAFHR